jgi:hypothetical protein
MSRKMKQGRPPVGAEAETVKVIHAGLDEDTKKALQRLEAQLVGPKRGKTSAVVRRALHDAAARLARRP